MTQRPRANEIEELVQHLGSRSRTRVDAARARLLIIGARAVENLIDALEGANNKIRMRVIPLLALIQDPRGREPLIVMLLDRSRHLRAGAARSLARFPSPESVAALNRSLKKDRSVPVKVAAVQSLVEQYSAGQEQAIRLVLEVLSDSSQSPAVRTAAFSLLRALRPSQRRSVLDRLKSDSEAVIREKAAEFVLTSEGQPEAKKPEMGRLLKDLAAEDYANWNEAIERLAACGSAAIKPLIAEMQSRSHDPEYCTRAGMTLKALGPRRARALADSLDQFEEPLPLQVLVEVIGAIGEKSLIYRLKELIERISRQGSHTAQADGFDPMQRVRAKAHLELARIGSRVAIGDLRSSLMDPEQRVELEALAACELIGKREDIELLLLAYGREDGFTQQRIAEAVLAIMRRERIRRNSRIFLKLRRPQRLALAEILPPAAPSRRRKPCSRRGAVERAH